MHVSFATCVFHACVHACGLTICAVLTFIRINLYSVHRYTGSLYIVITDTYIIVHVY